MKERKNLETCCAGPQVRKDRQSLRKIIMRNDLKTPGIAESGIPQRHPQARTLLTPHPKDQVSPPARVPSTERAPSRRSVKMYTGK
jgi:hypothetical protein